MPEPSGKKKLIDDLVLQYIQELYGLAAPKPDQTDHNLCSCLWKLFLSAVKINGIFVLEKHILVFLPAPIVSNALLLPEDGSNASKSGLSTDKRNE